MQPFFAKLVRKSMWLRRRNGSESEHDNTERGDIVLDDERKVIFEINFNLAAKVGTLDEV